MGISTRLGHYRSTQKVIYQWIFLLFFCSTTYEKITINQIYLFHFSRYVTDKLLQYCEKLTDASVTTQRKILDNATFVVPFESDGNLVQFQKTTESFLVSKQPLKPITDISNAEIELPDIHPLHSNISIDKENIYQKRNVYRKLSTNISSETKKMQRFFSKFQL